MKLINKLMLLLLFSSVLSGCVEDEMVNNQRRILSINIDGQIGMAELPTSMEDENTAAVLIQDGVVDFSNLALEIVVSPGATISPASKEPIDFTANGYQYTYTVTSESGISKEWIISVETFVNPLKGTWRIENLEFYWDDWFGWGNSGSAPLAEKFPETAPGLDDIITMGAIENLTPEGAVYGDYERQAGSDGEFASFIYTPTGKDWAYKFDHMKGGTGKWQLNVDNTVTFTHSSGAKYTSKSYERPDDNTLIIKLNPGGQEWDIDWGDYYGNDENKFRVAWDVWYTLKKQ